MIVDFHGHIGHLDGRAVSSEQLTAYMDAAEIQRLLCSNLDAASHGGFVRNVDEPDANMAVLDAHKQDTRILPAYWVRVGRFDSNVLAFAGAMDAEPFVAAVFAPCLNDYEIDTESLDPYLAVLARNHRPALFVLDGDERTDPVRLYRIAQRHPSVAVVFCCDARNSRMREAVDTAERAVRRRDARLYWAASHASAADVADAVKLLGDDHVLFATDALASDDHAEHSTALLEELRGCLSAEEFIKVTSDNARRLLRLAD